MSRPSAGSVPRPPGGDAGLELGEGRRAGQRVLSALQNCDVDEADLVIEPHDAVAQTVGPGLGELGNTARIRRSFSSACSGSVR